MKYWKDQLLRDLPYIKDTETLFAATELLIRQLGFKHYAYTFYTSPSPLCGSAQSHNNYPPAWNRLYQQRHFQSIDPITLHCQHSLLPLLWSDEAFIRHPDFREQQKNHGLAHGLSQSTHDALSRKSILSIARTAPALSLEEFHEKSNHAIWLCNLLHIIMTDIQLSLDSPHKLSPREVEVLRWSALGKTVGQIAQLLQLSERTVNFHIGAAIRKLGAANKTAAVARAALHGLI
ncbi:LuxR family transcriptional regulator [Pseudomonas sp. MWU12-2037]|uniref:helix-turn-helix transcriptional regulator n=1 Tax=Pseudomonas sp. MWU12-2037 TaxID=2928690 RepID=UPI00200EBA03|nr:LuxR family transcriptional regulator [Pseudomonas sp. MWU12-2037]